MPSLNIDNIIRQFLNHDKSNNFIPFACYFDKDTIITKNGSLMQTIMIKSLQREQLSNWQNLRNIIQDAIKSKINSKLAFWIHTTKSMSDIVSDDDNIYEDILSANINDIWNDKYHFRDKLMKFCLFVMEFWNTFDIGRIYRVCLFLKANLNM